MTVQTFFLVLLQQYFTSSALTTAEPSSAPTQSGELEFVSYTLSYGSACEGDCDNDDECAYGLLCFERDMD